MNPFDRIRRMRLDAARTKPNRHKRSYRPFFLDPGHKALYGASGLPNRPCFEIFAEHVRQELAQHWGVAVVALALDNYEASRGSGGKHCEDDRLKRVTHVVAKQLRPCDLVGCLDRQTILLLLPLRSHAELAPTLQKIRIALSRDVGISRAKYSRNTVSIGVRQSNDKELPISTLVDDACRTVERAMRYGSNRLAYYD